MLTRTEIRNMANAASFRKGKDIYDSDKILGFTVEEDAGNDCDNIYAQVKGSGRNIYDIEIQIDKETGEVVYSECDCPAYWEYEGLCKHCVGVLLEFIDYQFRRERSRSASDTKNKSLNALKGIPRGLARHTTPAMEELLKRQVVIKTLPFVQGETCGKVRLVPRLQCGNNGAALEFKIGVEQMYVLKDVLQFSRRMKECEDYSYGKKLRFVHAMDSFAEESKPFAKFIMKWAAMNEDRYRSYSYRGYYYGGPTAASVRHMELSGPFLEEFFQAVGDKPFLATIFSQPETQWSVCREPFWRQMWITGSEDGIEVKIERVSGYAANEYYIYFVEGKIYLQRREEAEPIREFLECMSGIPDRRVFIEKKDVPVFCKELLPVLKQFYHCETENFDEDAYGFVPAEFHIYLDLPQENMVSCKTMVKYGEKEYSVYDDKDLTLRDVIREVQVKNLVGEYANAYDPQLQSVMLADDEVLLYELLVHGIPRMQAVGTVYVSDALKCLEVREVPKITVGVSIDGNLLELTLTAGDMSKEELVEILSRYNRKKKFYRLKNGAFVSLENSGMDAAAELRAGLMLTDRQLKQEKIHLQKYRALYLDSQLKENPSIGTVKDKAFRSLVRNMKTVEDNDFEIPRSMEGVLREYQKTGFLWIKTLKHNGFGGILADDMGLGKTLQVICFLVSETEERAANAAEKEADFSDDGITAGTQRRNALIVTPASLVYNWSSEIERFAPRLTAKMVVGSVKERKEILETAGAEDILLTSYDLMKRDVELYQKYTFRCQVLDEAQYIKNHNTQAAKAVKQIQAELCLALTGTPVENRLSELWSIFDYLMPGFLYGYEKFRGEIETPVVQNGDEQAMTRLQKMIAPFVLRRLKKDVLLDLPDKLEENMYARLEGEQQKLYDAHVKRMKLLLDKQTDEEFKTSKIVILSELTKLRQICCDPGLLLENYRGESAKADMCMGLISSAVENGHKILLFSQFTSMLEVLERCLQKENISYYTLTGATSKEKRARMVEAFNQDDTSVFCISLKAGGTGLNLTAADIVIHYDPWWNLAVQNQATDRAHRIGQKNAVNVYKLIAKGTIEENIVKLQEKKRELADQILSGEAMSGASFTKEELLELLGQR